MQINGGKNPAYDSIAEGQFIEVDGFGRFIITRVTAESEGNEFECKDCEAAGTETLLGQKYLELFTINMGTAESIDGVKFYNPTNPAKSLLHLALEKCPDWTIGHVDTALMPVERCFELTRQDVYSFLTQDAADAFQCVFLFDTLHQRINIYSEDTVGNDTDIFVTYDNLLKSTNLSSSVDDIKTCLTVTGANDLNLREVNMGYDRIYMLDYYHSPEFMSEGLYDAYGKWLKKWNSNISNYSSLLSQYQNFYTQIHELTNKKMPSNPESTNWAEYGLVPLQEKLAALKQRQAVMIKAGMSDKTHKDYHKSYLPVFNSINTVQSQISVVEKQISSLREQQASVGARMDSISSALDMKQNFTPEQLQELTKFIREEELSSSNFVVTDTMTDSERMDMLGEMLAYGQKELRKISQPQLQFHAEMANIFELDAFKNCSADFEPGNYIHIILRDDYIVKARLLSIDMDFYHPDDFSVTFGNTNKVKGKNIYTDTTKALDTAASVATTVSFNSSNWNKANRDANDINKMISDGLLAAGESLRTSKSDVTIDDRGIIISNTPESQYPNDRIFIGNSQMLFSDDNFKTTKTALGRVSYTKKGVTYNDFGLIAQLVFAGYIAGSTIEGNEIIAGSITGTDFNNGNGTFHVDSQGNLTAASAVIKGEINADSGHIGGSNGFTIKAGSFYSGNKSSFSSGSSGVYIGTDGISLGQNNVFQVTSDGNLIANNATVKGTVEATGGTIGGFSITDTQIISTDEKVGMSSTPRSGWAVWAGNLIPNTNQYAFCVGHEGEVFASNICATGGTVGGFSITDTQIISTDEKVGMSSTPRSGWAVWAGNLIPNTNRYEFCVGHEGAIYASKGLIGGANIIENSIYTDEWYIAADGRAWFKNINVEGGTIGGAQISNNSIRSSNGNWWINYDGTARFGNISINSSGGTCGNFDNGFSADTSFELNGGARSNFNALVVNNITAENIRATNVLADYATIANLNSSSISVNRLRAGTVNDKQIDWRQVVYVTNLSMDFTDVVTDVNFTEKTIQTKKIMHPIWVHYKCLYVLCEDSIISDIGV